MLELDTHNIIVPHIDDRIQNNEERDNLLIACSLAWSKIMTLSPELDSLWHYFKIRNQQLTDVKPYHFMGIIHDSSIKRHTIVILQPTVWEFGPTLGQTCIISDDDSVTVLSSEYESEFNNVIIREKITVESYDLAEKIARLFVRVMMPLISQVPLFFADELTYQSYWEYLEKSGRSEMQKIEMAKILYSEYQNNFNKELCKKKWLIQISKKGNRYIVTMFTVGRIIAGYNDFAPPGYDRILRWEVVVNYNGTISVKLPKGIRIYTIHDR